MLVSILARSTSYISIAILLLYAKLGTNFNIIICKRAKEKIFYVLGDHRTDVARVMGLIKEVDILVKTR